MPFAISWSRVALHLRRRVARNVSSCPYALSFHLTLTCAPFFPCLKCPSKGITSNTADVSSRASALEAIVTNDYIDLLNSLPVVKLLHAKWVRGARGHYFGQLALFCMALVLHALLCQHRRQGVADVFIHGSRETVLKAQIQSAAMCRAPYLAASIAPNGSAIVTKVGRCHNRVPGV